MDAPAAPAAANFQNPLSVVFDSRAPTHASKETKKKESSSLQKVETQRQAGYTEWMELHIKLVKFNKEIQDLGKSKQKVVENKQKLVDSEAELKSVRDELLQELALRLELMKNAQESKNTELEISLESKGTELEMMKISLESKDGELGKLKLKLSKLEGLCNRMIQLSG